MSGPNHIRRTVCESYTKTVVVSVDLRRPQYFSGLTVRTIDFLTVRYFRERRPAISGQNRGVKCLIPFSVLTANYQAKLCGSPAVFFTACELIPVSFFPNGRNLL